MTQVIQENVKNIFDKRTKVDDFNIGDRVLRWDSRREDKGKHGKFDNLWNKPYIVYVFRGNNAFYLKDLDGVEKAVLSWSSGCTKTWL